MEPRVAVIESVDVGQDDQPFCTAEYGYDGREHIVVAEQTVLGFDLCVAYGVILIDDRDHAHFQQGVERIGQVFLLLFLLDVLCIEKDLGYGLVIIPEKLVIEVHEAALSDSGGGLFHTHAVVVRAALHAQLVPSHGNGSGGDQDHFVSHILDIRQRADQAVRGAQVALA